MSRHPALQHVVVDFGSQQAGVVPASQTLVSAASAAEGKAST
jgi:hypothetical protein